MDRFLHIETNKQKYNKEISKCIDETIIVEGNTTLPPNPNYDTKLVVENIDIIDSMIIHQNDGENRAVLNHASYKEPAQQYLKGSSGREETLCDYSFLFNVLSSTRLIKEYYNPNKKKLLNKGMYSNRGLYSPNVLFNKDGKNCIYSVISTTAPNRQQSIQYKMFTEEENKVALRERLEFILNIAAKNKVDVLMLGAFGCSVYRQNPSEVASIWRELLSSNYMGYFKYIYIPIINNDQYKIFHKIFT